MSEECPDNQCHLSAGIGIALRIAESAGVDANDIKKQVLEQKITVGEAMSEIKARVPGEWEKGLIEEVEDLMAKEQEKISCVSVKVKHDMGNQIEDWIENRDLPEIVKENLRKSKEAIENLPTCEAL